MIDLRSIINSVPRSKAVLKLIIISTINNKSKILSSIHMINVSCNDHDNLNGTPIAVYNINKIIDKSQIILGPEYGWNTITLGKQSSFSVANNWGYDDNVPPISAESRRFLCLLRFPLTLFSAELFAVLPANVLIIDWDLCRNDVFSDGLFNIVSRRISNNADIAEYVSESIWFEIGLWLSSISIFSFWSFISSLNGILLFWRFNVSTLSCWSCSIWFSSGFDGVIL